jgi:hypothetical protein
MSDELKDGNILTLILIMRFACATLDMGHPIQKTFYPCVTPENRNETLFGWSFASKFQTRHLDLRRNTNDENIQERTSFRPLLICIQTHIVDIVRVSGEALRKGSPRPPLIGFQ